MYHLFIVLKGFGSASRVTAASNVYTKLNTTAAHHLCNIVQKREKLSKVTVHVFLKMVFSTNTLIITVFFCNLILKDKTVVAELSIIPLWNATSYPTDSTYCSLKTSAANAGVIATFNGDPVHTCSILLEATNGTAALIRIPYGIPSSTLLYVVRQEEMPNCRNRRVVIDGPKPCTFPFWLVKSQVFLQGNTSFHISEISVNKSTSICPEDDGEQIQLDTRVNQTNHCQIKQYEDEISCFVTSDGTCFTDFPSQCYATLRDRYVDFKCQSTSIHLSHAALFVYPIGIITLVLKGHSIVEITENHFQKLDTLKKLILDYNMLRSLPNGVFKDLGTLTYLSIKGNQLNELDGPLFNGLRRLTYLSLNDNKLGTLPENLFKDLENLQILWVGRNRLVSLPLGLFKTLHNLVTLYIYKNQIVELDDNLFQETTKLTYLSAGDNDITSLPAKLFRRTPSLQTLKMYRNRITFLPNGLLKGLGELKILHLYGNQITSLDEHLFNDTENLIEFNIGNNALTDLPHGLFIGLRNLKFLKLYGNQITSLGKNLFNDTNALVYISLYANKLKILPTYLFRGLNNLEELLIMNNTLQLLSSKAFQDLLHLETLFLMINELTELHYDQFWELNNLQTLRLEDNRLKHLDYRIFRGLRKLQILFLSNNSLYELDIRIFHDLVDLNFIELSGNNLKDIPYLGRLQQLSFVNIKGNKMTSISKYTFTNLTKGLEMIVSQHEICECYVSVSINCSAADSRSPYLTCSRLLSDRTLMVMMWVIGLSALGGNLFVLSWRKLTPDKRSKVQAFLLSNLAMSDLLMGIYMIIIAWADIYFGENFPMLAETWRSGVTCKVAGTISIIASEASVFFVTLISFDRFMHIKFPFSRHNLGSTSSIVVVGVLWFIALTLGLVPSFMAGKNFKFYDNSHVCIGLPLAKIQQFSQYISYEKIPLGNSNHYYTKESFKSIFSGYGSGLYFATAMFLGLNCVCYLIVVICYIEIIRGVFKSSQQAGMTKEIKDQMRMTAKVAAIVLTDFFCWFPIIVLGILVQADVLILPPSVFAWCVTFILPINSAINPYLYTISAIITNRRKQTQNSQSQSDHSQITLKTSIIHQSQKREIQN